MCVSRCRLTLAGAERGGVARLHQLLLSACSWFACCCNQKCVWHAAASRWLALTRQQPAARLQAAHLQHNAPIAAAAAAAAATAAAAGLAVAARPHCREAAVIQLLLQHETATGERVPLAEGVGRRAAQQRGRAAGCRGAGSGARRASAARDNGAPRSGPALRAAVRCRSPLSTGQSCGRAAPACTSTCLVQTRWPTGGAFQRWIAIWSAAAAAGRPTAALRCCYRYQQPPAAAAEAAGPWQSRAPPSRRAPLLCASRRASQDALCELLCSSLLLLATVGRKYASCWRLRAHHCAWRPWGKQPLRASPDGHPPRDAPAACLHTSQSPAAVLYPTPTPKSLQCTFTRMSQCKGEGI